MKHQFFLKRQARNLFFGPLLRCLLLFLCFATVSQAQGWKELYYPTEGKSQGYKAVEALDGGYLQVAQLDIPVQGGFLPDIRLTKVDVDGALQWEKIIDNHEYYEFAYDLISMPDGGYMIVGAIGDVGATNSHETRPMVIKLDAFGNEEWMQTYGDGNFGTAYDIDETADGNYIISGEQGSGTVDIYALKIDASGAAIWENSYDIKSYNWVGLSIVANADGSFTTVGFSIDNGDNFLRLVHLDANGTELWRRDLFNPNYSATVSLTGTADGGFLLASGQRITKTDASGNEEWTKLLSLNGAFGYDVVSTADQGFVFAGVSSQGATAVKTDSLGNIIWQHGNLASPSYFRGVTAVTGGFLLSGYQFVLVGQEQISVNLLTKLDENGFLYGNVLMGNIYHDLNKNCAFETEPSLENWLLEASGAEIFYALTDDNGNYKIDVPDGTYDLKLYPASPVWKACLQGGPVQAADTVVTDFGAQAIVDCPYLTTDISVPFLRRCFENNYTVTYANQGTADTTGVYIEVEIDSSLVVNSTTIPITAQNGNTYTFFIGDLAMGQTGSFQINVTPDCAVELGATLCVEANIFPHNPCLTPQGAWDGSITTLDVSCAPDSVTFTITNTGLQDMAMPLDYSIVEDNLIIRSGTYQLVAGGNKTLKVPANGSTYRLHAYQAAGYFPPNYIPTIAIERCGTDPITNDFSLGFINSFGEDDILHYISRDCQVLIGSYDPNDKAAQPAGLGDEHYINVGDELDYRIRFQNVGNDTAFTVVIRDTLSPHLDVSSLQAGAASHFYDLEIINGNILKFTFPDILLVDSTTNEAGSHGFVKFKIAQTENLPIGTIINNQAAIYFDFNAPVITNETYHEIGEDFVEVLLETNILPQFPELAVSVSPNPFTRYTNFEIKGMLGEKHFQLFDAAGKLQSEARFDGEHYRFEQQNLSNGLYFYTIRAEAVLLASGKVVVW